MFERVSVNWPLVQGVTPASPYGSCDDGLHIINLGKIKKNKKTKAPQFFALFSFHIFCMKTLTESVKK